MKMKINMDTDGFDLQIETLKNSGEVIYILFINPNSWHCHFVIINDNILK